MVFRRSDALRFECDGTPDRKFVPGGARKSQGIELLMFIVAGVPIDLRARCEKRHSGHIQEAGG
jgi:hypothetical protein